jgi:hypothetical protein
MTRYYATINTALNALCLDMGFNPFLLGGIVDRRTGRRYRKPTKAALASWGYYVDPKATAAAIRLALADGDR